MKNDQTKGENIFLGLKEDHDNEKIAVRIKNDIIPWAEVVSTVVLAFLL